MSTLQPASMLPRARMDLPLKWLWLVAAAISFLGFNADSSEPERPNFFARTWRTDNGLPDNAVTAIVQTHDGYLWVGTYGGLARFDGVHFTVFNSANEPELQSDRITSLFEDAHGTLWIGHERGDLTSYRDGKFKSQKIREIGIRRKISAIGSDAAGDIWMLNEEGTMVRARDGATCALQNQDGVVLMAQNTSGKLWVASGGKIAELANGKLIPLANSNRTVTVNGYIQGMCPAQDGKLWIVRDGRIQKWNGQSWTEDRGTNPCNSTVTAMIETRNGNLAFGTVGDGLYLQLTNGTVLHFNQSDGLPHDWVRCLTEDREDTLWVGAGSGGIAALRPGKVQTLVAPDRWQGRVALSTTAARDGSIWVGTEGAGLYRFLNGEWTQFGTSDGFSNQFIWCVSEDMHGRIWAGTWGGGIFMQQGDRFVLPPGLQNMTVPMAAILQTRDDVTWIGTANGLIRYQDGAVKWFGAKEGLEAPDVRAIVQETNGTIWFGMLGGGLGKLQDGHLSQFRKEDGLSSDYLQCLHLDSAGALWIGTYGSGLCRFKDGHFAKITSAAGLPNNFICDIEEDGHGNFWISSHGGIFRISQKTLDNCADGKISAINCLTYGKGDGMPSLECSGGLQPAAAQTPDGKIWFPTSRGLVVVNPGNARINRLPPAVVIEDVIASGQRLARDPAGRPQLRIAPGQQRFEFHYTGLSFVSPDKMQFQYRLEGWEHDWVDAGNKRVAEYNYIPPGDYVFRVRACNSDGVWNDAGATLTLKMLPHFWQTLWFHFATILVVIVAVAAIVLFITRRRMRRKLEVIQRQQAIERERTRIAKDIHDHLGANLTRISLLSQAAQGELENPAQAATQLDRIYDTARELTRAMDEIVWAVNPHHDTLDSLANYLGNFALEYLGSIDIRCRLDVPLQLPPWPITAEMRHNVFLAFKEALHNVAKHSQATEVQVLLTTQPNAFTLAIRDNGRGFDLKTADADVARHRLGRGNGLKNMRQRLEKIGGRCEIESASGTGTEIKFTVNVSAPRNP